MFIEGGQINGMLRAVNSGHIFLYGSGFIVNGISVKENGSLSDYAIPDTDPWGTRVYREL